MAEEKRPLQLFPVVGQGQPGEARPLVEPQLPEGGWPPEGDSHLVFLSTCK